MKKATFILTAALFMISCKKGSVDFTSYIKGNLNGVSFESNSNIKAFKPMPVPGRTAAIQP